MFGHEIIKSIFIRVLLAAHENHMFNEVGHALELLGITEGSYSYRQCCGCLLFNKRIVCLTFAVLLIYVISIIIILFSPGPPPPRMEGWRQVSGRVDRRFSGETDGYLFSVPGWCALRVPWVLGHGSCAQDCDCCCLCNRYIVPQSIPSIRRITRVLSRS